MLMICLCLLLLMSACGGQTDSSPTLPDVERAHTVFSLLEDGRVLVEETFFISREANANELLLQLKNPAEGSLQFQDISLRDPSDASDAYHVLPIKDTTVAQTDFYALKTTLRATLLDVELSSRHGSSCHIRVRYTWDRGLTAQDETVITEGSFSSLPAGTYVKNMEWTFILPSFADVNDAEWAAVTSVRMDSLAESSQRLHLTARESVRLSSTDSMCFTLPKYDAFSTPLSALTLSPTARFDAAKREAVRLVGLHETRRALPPVLGITSAFVLLYWLTVTFLRYVYPYKFGDTFAVFPSTTKAAYLPLLLESRNEADVILSTLFSLITRKELSWDDEILVWNNPERNDFSAFTTWEAFLLQWLFDPSVDSNPALSAQLLRRETRSAVGYHDFQEQAKTFFTLLDKDMKATPYVNPILTKVLKIISLILSLTLVILSVFLIFFARSLFPLILFLPAGLLLVQRRRRMVLTREGICRFREVSEYRKALSEPERLIKANDGIYSDVETLISALPNAIALNRVDRFFDGLATLPNELFTRNAYALLHVYRGFPLTDIPSRTSEEEAAFLRHSLEHIKSLIKAWEALFRACLIG